MAKKKTGKKTAQPTEPKATTSRNGVKPSPPPTPVKEESVCLPWDSIDSDQNNRVPSVPTEDKMDIDDHPLPETQQDVVDQEKVKEKETFQLKVGTIPKQFSYTLQQLVRVPP